MQKIFLSFHFNSPQDVDKHDSILADQVQTLIRSHGLVTVTGDTLGGGVLTPEVMSLIDESDALIALMTRRGPAFGPNNDQYETHPWVRDEYGHARAKQKPAIAVVETGISSAGAYAGNERADYSREAPLSAFLKLSSTIGKWKRQSGRTVEVQLLPDPVAESIVDAAGAAECYYRRISPGPVVSDWKKTMIYPKTGGTFIYVPEMDEETSVQVKAVIGGVEHISRQTSQYLPVVLKKAVAAGGGS